MTNPTEEKQTIEIDGIERTMQERKEEKKCEHGMPMFQSCDKCGREMVKAPMFTSQQIKKVVELANADMRKTAKLYTEDEVRQAAKGGAANERIHWIRKLKGLKSGAQTKVLSYTGSLNSYEAGNVIAGMKIVFERIDKLLVEGEKENV